MGKMYQHFTDRIPGFLFSIGLMHKRISVMCQSTVKFEKCPISETAKNNGGKELGGYCRWWLRTNAVYKNSFIFVEGDGSYRTNSGTSGNQTEVCVRPAMWVTI